MTKLLSLTITTAVLLTTATLSAYCPTCARIEAERAKQQAAHPQDVGYYDDQAKKDQTNTGRLAQPTESNQDTNAKAGK